ncbi:28 kDa heat- and acid-stable phosphoprotein [Agrilus planipennis]|uniref:28 kDa heat- and acid-stable phosphoprotein n=1 Tax=Agrilus planipennis TaxID=224129 RepID=A0A1W4XGP2_AGRPL|nr:28 kDa heat- and acid-stable phosphoprotein [Agrilus planipennis]XP_025832308.1 28 kDa heat- and acid-stable phosphoprotein [Agrilus planipennis]
MPRGKFTSHKGRNRRFTNPEELEEERRKEEQQRKWRQQRGEVSSSDEEEAGDEENSEAASSEEETDSDEEPKAKGVSNLIEIENPNRVQKKAKKLSTLNTSTLSDDSPQLSRREREEIEKQKAQAHYQKLHAEGKTEQARADLARLAIIKQQREEAQKRREQEKKQKEEAAKQKTAQTQKALGKK